ncbi:hypothetical protein CAXC1_70010 [Candidatus Xenohaliotis californiensis]|uniref:Uncharacterized protein n=1 Tax=Candidatus Xenohaliotis californiensis TaxID=84677 RepID=A0ABP0ETY3_9RICK|nr:hypothetical protein CAXC1_70010 [Candidatus Xenohaliotis californiensis]
MPKQPKSYFNPADLKNALATKVDDGINISVYKTIYRLRANLLNMSSESNFFKKFVYWTAFLPVSILCFIADNITLLPHPLAESEIYLFLDNWVKDSAYDENTPRVDVLNWMQVHFLRPRVLPYEYRLLFGSDYASDKSSDQAHNPKNNQTPESFVSAIMGAITMLEKDLQSRENEIKENKDVTLVQDKNALGKDFILRFQDICNIASVLTVVCLTGEKYGLLQDIHRKILCPIRQLAKRVVNPLLFDQSIANHFKGALLPLVIAPANDERIVEWNVMYNSENNNGFSLKRVGCSKDDLFFVGLMSDNGSDFTTKEKCLKDRAFYSFPPELADHLDFMLRTLTRGVTQDGHYIYGFSVFDIRSVDGVNSRKKDSPAEWTKKGGAENDLSKDILGSTKNTGMKSANNQDYEEFNKPIDVTDVDENYDADKAVSTEDDLNKLYDNYDGNLFATEDQGRDINKAIPTILSDHETAKDGLVQSQSP